MLLEYLMFRNNLPVEMSVNSVYKTVSKFLSRDKNAFITLTANSSNNDSNIVYIGNNSLENELFISLNTETNKLASFNRDQITLARNVHIQGHLIAQSNYAYNISNVNDAYLTDDSINLKDSHIILNADNTDVSFIDLNHTVYNDLKAKRLTIQDDDGNYSILDGSILTSYTADNTILSQLNLNTLSTDDFTEDGNLYFKREYVTNLLSTTSNTDVTSTSNELVDKWRSIESNIKLDIEHYRTSSSNIAKNGMDDIKQQLTDVTSVMYVNTSNYIGNTNRGILNNIDATSNAIQTYILASEAISNIFRYADNMSNMFVQRINDNSNGLTLFMDQRYMQINDAVYNSSNQQNLQIGTYSNLMVELIGMNTVSRSEYLGVASNMLLDTVGKTSNALRDFVDNTSNATNIYLMSMSNMLLDNLTKSSNAVYTYISTTGIISNTREYVTSASNQMMINLDATSNSLNTRITALNTDDIAIGTSNMMIIDGSYYGSILNVNNVTTVGDVCPAYDVASDLGASNLKWKDLYLSGNSIYLNNLIISVDPTLQGIVIKDSSNQLSKLVTSAVKLYDAAKDNYTSLQSVGDKLQIEAYTASGEIDVNVERIKTTSSYPEPLVNASNLYYTPSRVAAIVSASNLLTSNYTSNLGDVVAKRISLLNTDQIQVSSGYDFIVNGVYDKDLRINGKLTASNLNVVGARTLINTVVYETENMLIDNVENVAGLQVTQLGNGAILDLYSNNQRVFVVKADGKVGIGNIEPTEKLDVVGDILFTDMINNVTSNELAQVSGLRSLLQLQLDDARSNINRYIDRTSNQLSSNLRAVFDRLNERPVRIDSNTSNYMRLTLQGYTNVLVDTSNNLATTLGRLDSNMSNYIRNASNVISSNLIASSNNFSTRLTVLNRNASNYLERTSNDFIPLLVSTSNDLNRSVNALVTSNVWTILGTNIYTNSNVGISTSIPAEKLDVNGDIVFTGLINSNVGSNQIVFMRGITGGSIHNQIFINDLNASNYIRQSSNAVNSNITATSNMLINNILTLNTNMSNYVRITSNTFASNLVVTSNVLSARIAGLSTNTDIAEKWRQIQGSNLYVWSNLNNFVGIGTSSLNNRLEVAGGDVMITGGGARRTSLSPPFYIPLHPVIKVNNVVQTPILISGLTYYYSFTDTSVTNSIEFLQPTTCDVFLIGGGGGGGGCSGGIVKGGGGGAGACVISIGYTFATGVYNVQVGAGGYGRYTSGSGAYELAFNGSDSSIGTLFVAKGGGRSPHLDPGSNTSVGGCTGGQSASGQTFSIVTTNVVSTNTNGTFTSGPTTATNISYIVLGKSGGVLATYGNVKAGGGGIGTVGANTGEYNLDTGVGKGGNGIYQVTINGTPYTLKTHFSFNSSFGVNDGSGNFYIGGGGGGGGSKEAQNTPLQISGGLGGGGVGYIFDGNNSADTTNYRGGHGTPNTGSGGGTGHYTRNTGEVIGGGRGGSGLVIIRYTAPTVASNITYNEPYQIERWQDNDNYYQASAIKSIYTQDNVGIGTTNPQAELHISSGTSTTTQNMTYFNNSTTLTSTSSYTLNNICATFDSSILVNGSIASSSDTRIKKNITDINDDSALQKILAIEPKTYEYIDRIKPTSNIYGFLAQQIASVIPEAVTTQTDVIPNIYTYADCSDNIITFANDINVGTNSNLFINNKVDIIDITEKRDTYTIIDNNSDQNSITIDKSIAGNKVFVYGTKVSDFHTLNKSYIYTLNVCATQTLAQKVLDIKTRLSNLEAS